MNTDLKHRLLTGAKKFGVPDYLRATVWAFRISLSVIKIHPLKNINNNNNLLGDIRSDTEKCFGSAVILPVHPRAFL